MGHLEVRGPQSLIYEPPNTGPTFAVWNVYGVKSSDHILGLRVIKIRLEGISVTSLNMPRWCILTITIKGGLRPLLHILNLFCSHLLCLFFHPHF